MPGSESPEPPRLGKEMRSPRTLRAAGGGRGRGGGGALPVRPELLEALAPCWATPAIRPGAPPVPDYPSQHQFPVPEAVRAGGPVSAHPGDALPVLIDAGVPRRHTCAPAAAGRARARRVRLTTIPRTPIYTDRPPRD